MHILQHSLAVSGQSYACKQNGITVVTKKETDRTSRYTQACIGHIAPPHRGWGGHVQKRSMHRESRRGKNKTGKYAEQP